MFKKILPLIFILLIAGCSAQRETVSERKNETSAEAEGKKQQALDHFINGSIAESKGEYAAAILEYQDALSLDPSSGIYYSLAKNYFYLNKLSLALQNCRKAVELDSSIEYLDLYSDIFSSAHQNDSAIVVLQKVLALDSSKVNSYYKLARLYEPSRPLKAIEVYNKLTEIIGPEWNVLLHVAELHEQLNEYSEAAKAVERLLTIDPSNIQIQKLLMELYQKSQKYDSALQVVNDILELTPDDLDARERKGQLYLAQNKWEEASKEYNYIIKQQKVPFDIKLRIGVAYFNKSLSDSTITPIAKEFFKQIDKDTTDWQVKMYLGAIALNEKDDSTAIENFRLVTELANWNVDGWVHLGGLYFDNRRYSEAVTVLNEAIASFPDNFAVNLLLGLSYAQQDKHRQARDYLKKSVELNPKDINALSAYAYTLNQLKDNDQAVEYLKKALEIKPDDINLLGTLGLIYDSQEKWDDCDSIYERALTIDSSNALVNNNYAYSLSERGIKLEKALKMAKIAVEKDPANSSYLDTIGWVYFKLGDYEKAKNYLLEAIKAGGEKSVMLEHLGDVVYKAGEKDHAKELWQKALNLDENNNKLKLKIEKGEI
ncbi:MAG TPA: tetratricopeptide repeat protein [Ignavibacteriaceae bacterium]|nr:tetratricopeptide repeat protein [Ignavibacteriaceae bacterium]